MRARPHPAMGSFGAAPVGAAAAATLLLLMAMSASAQGSSPGGRSRQCCRYAWTTIPESGASPESSSPCAPGPEACLVRLTDGEVTSPSLERCNVESDSKRDSGGDPSAKATCLAESFDPGSGGTDSWMEHLEEPPFSLAAYAFEDSSTSGPIPAVEVRLRYGPSWGAARFRLRNRRLCPDDLTGEPDQKVPPECSPRCVHILKNHDAHRGGDAELAYDCEVGFASSGSVPIRVTSGDIYEFSVCLSGVAATGDVSDGVRTECGSYDFVMPAAETGGMSLDGIPLLDRRPLEEDGTVVLHFPGHLFPEKELQYEAWVALEGREDEDEGWEELAVKGVPVTGRYSTLVFREEDLDLDPGLYRLVYKRLGQERGLDVAHFSVDRGSGGASVAGLVVFVLLLLAAGGAGYYLYGRWREIRVHPVHPNRLLESERIAGKRVLVITNVDNRHHIDVVMAFNR